MTGYHAAGQAIHALFQIIIVTRSVRIGALKDTMVMVGSVKRVLNYPNEDQFTYMKPQ